MNVKCENCGINFNKKHSSIKRTKHNFCSRICWYKKADIDVVNRDFFQNIDTEEKAYWLGFIYADGSIHSSINRLQILLSTKDKSHLLKFAKIFAAKVVDKKRKYGTSVCYVYGSKICNSLIEKGVKPRKTYIDSSEIFNHVPSGLLNHFVRGYFDGDGTVGKNNITSFCGFVGVLSFIHNLNNIVSKSCGISLNKIHKDGNIYSISWSGFDQLNHIRKWLYKDAQIFLERKKQVFDSLESKKHNKSSKYNGVSWIKGRNKWQSMIRYKNVIKFIGYFNCEIEAAKAYDLVAESMNVPMYKRNFLV